VLNKPSDYAKHRYFFEFECNQIHSNSYTWGISPGTF